MKLSISYDLNENDTFLILCEWAEDEVPGQNLLLHACINYLKKWNSMSVIWVFKYFFLEFSVVGAILTLCLDEGEERRGEDRGRWPEYTKIPVTVPSSPILSHLFPPFQTYTK